MCFQRLGILDDGGSVFIGQQRDAQGFRIEVLGVRGSKNGGGQHCGGDKVTAVHECSGLQGFGNQAASAMLSVRGWVRGAAV